MQSHNNKVRFGMWPLVIGLTAILILVGVFALVTKNNVPTLVAETLLPQAMPNPQAAGTSTPTPNIAASETAEWARQTAVWGTETAAAQQTESDVATVVAQNQIELATWQAQLTESPIGTPAPGPTGVVEGPSGDLPSTAYLIQNRWYGTANSNGLIVYAGAYADDPDQGLVHVLVDAPGRQAVEQDYLTPLRAGSVRIVAEQNARLTLVSTDNTMFYFDVPGEQFVSSLTEVVPTTTPLPPLPSRTPTITPYPTDTPLPPPMTLYLHSSGTTFFLDNAAPTGATPKFKDSSAVQFSGGNPWKEIGTWSAASGLTTGNLAALYGVNVWLGLKNSDDIGTSFDIGVELYKNGVLLVDGETDCISNLTRDPSQAREVLVPFDDLPVAAFNGTTDVMTLKVLARIGTDGAGNFCGGHGSAVGVRLYYDATNRPSRFELAIGQ